MTKAQNLNQNNHDAKKRNYKKCDTRFLEILFAFWVGVDSS
jgi:hypothetical protein